MAIVVHHNNNNALLQSAMALAGAWAEGDITQNIAQEEINQQAGEHRQEMVRGLFDNVNEQIATQGSRNAEAAAIRQAQAFDVARTKDAQSFQETRDANTEQARRSLAKYRFGLAIDEARDKEQYKADLQREATNNEMHNNNKVVDEVGMKRITDRYNMEVAAAEKQRDMLGDDGVRAAKEIALKTRNRSTIPMRSKTAKEMAAPKDKPGSVSIQQLDVGDGTTRAFSVSRDQNNKPTVKEIEASDYTKAVLEASKVFAQTIIGHNEKTGEEILMSPDEAAKRAAALINSVWSMQPGQANQEDPKIQPQPRQVSPELMAQAKKLIDQLDGPPGGWSDTDLAKAVQAAELIFKQVIAAGDKTLARKLQKILETDAKRRSASSN